MNPLALATPGTVAVSAGIGILLLVATVWIGILHRRKPGPGTKELVLRVRGWWVICALFLGAILAGGRAGVLLFGFISYLAFKEYVSLIPFRRVDRRALFWAYVAIPAQYAFICIGWYGMFLVFIPVPYVDASASTARAFSGSSGSTPLAADSSPLPSQGPLTCGGDLR